jgi:hypothetical protein
VPTCEYPQTIIVVDYFALELAMDSVVLFSFIAPGIKVTVESYFDEKGNLVVEGYDIGKSVEEFWGDRDYEYSMSVESGELRKLYQLFDIRVGEKAELLNAIQARYHTNHCYSEFRDFLSLNLIRFESFSWM